MGPVGAGGKGGCDGRRGLGSHCLVRTFPDVAIRVPGSRPLQDGDDVLPPQSLREPEFVMSLRIELVPLRTADEEMPDH